MSKKIIIIALVAIVAIVGFLEFKSLRDDETEVDMEREDVRETPVYETYSDPSLGFSFRYPSGPQGYVLEKSAVVDEATTIEETLLLVHKDDVPAFQNPPVGGEGPAVISILVFPNTQNQRPEAWAREHNAYSNINVALSDIEEAVIGGALAIRYRADGLYASEMSVITHGSHVYVFSGAFVDGDSPTLRDFGPLLDSVTFIPELGQE
jgi:hypothetical protein